MGSADDAKSEAGKDGEELGLHDGRCMVVIRGSTFRERFVDSEKEIEPMVWYCSCDGR